MNQQDRDVRDAAQETMTASELAKRISHGEKWKVAEPSDGQEATSENT